MYRLATLLVLALVGTGAWAARPLVDVLWVHENSCDPTVVVLDIRNGYTGDSEASYLAGHVPCAVYSDYLEDNWRVERDGVPGQIPPLSQMEALIGGLGIDNSTHVVVYHAGASALDAASATRVYWTFKALGHDEVSILDGGYAAYAAVDSFPRETGKRVPVAKPFRARLRKEMLLSRSEVDHLRKQGAVLVDDRPSDFFLGINQGEATRKGTIPGAKNLPESWFTVDGGGEFRTKENLKKLFDAVGVPLQGKVVTFCFAGHWSTLGWFAAHELLGNKEAVNYGGSFVDWSRAPDLPVEQRVKIDDF